MAPPRSKRQKRLVLLSSDDDEASETQPEQSVSTRPRRQAALVSKKDGSGKLNSRQPTQKADPRHSDKKISTFFTPAGHPPDAVKRSLQAREPQDFGQGGFEVEDVIEEVSDFEKTREPGATLDTTRSVLDRRKSISKRDYNTPSSLRQRGLPSGSQKFKVQNNGVASGRDAVKANIADQEPWIERFPPVNLEELAIHKKKVSDVRNWLENTLSSRNNKKLLVLKGPAGAGKTATVKILAKVLNLELSEWKNPMGSQYASEGYISMSANFEDFLGRSGKFKTLDLDSIPNQEKPISTAESSGQKIVLIEDFPNTVISRSIALYSFRSSILQSLATSRPSLPFHDVEAPVRSTNGTPLILVITETRLTSTSTPSDVFTAHRLLGTEILNHPAVSIIEFNPVAPTFIGKALDLVIQKEAKYSGRRHIPGPSVLAKLCEIGDVRSAIGSLEFLCVKSHDSDNWVDRVAARKQRGASGALPLTNLERDSLETVYLRENSLGLFHAVGKVVYNKRHESALGSTKESGKDDVVQPPDHLPEKFRPRQPETSIDTLIDEIGTDADTFIAALHENYVMSCEGPTLVDALDGCLSALSDCDLLSTSRNAKRGTIGFAAPSEILRRDEIAFQLAVRGLLFALPYPVKRSTHPTGVHGRLGGKGDSHKMFYPASLRLWRQTEQVEDLINQWYQFSKDAMTSSRKSEKGDYHSVEFEDPGEQRRNLDNQIPLMDHYRRHNEPLRPSLSCTKTELILERLPYFDKIKKANRFSNEFFGLESITQFHGIGFLRDETSEDEGMDVSMIRSTQPNTQPVRQQVGSEIVEGQMKNFPPVGEDIEKLYLSDDDIED